MAAPSGDVHEVRIGSVHHGDVHQVQQLVVLRYLALLGPLSPAPDATPARPTRGATAPARRVTAFPGSVTNPDNPWGFDFPPPVLAK
jgi:hypothetical protein